MKNEDIRCKEHPDAPHGFMRDASHNEDRYVCECEFWEPPKEEQKPVAYITGFHNGHCVIEPFDRATVLPVGMALYRRPLVEAEDREKVAQWMMKEGYATGHGDTVEELLKELEWQISEKLTSNHTAPFVTDKRSDKTDTRKSWTA